MLEWIIVESVRLKAQVVSADECESGVRRVLNFGHTIGHALEADSGYKRFLHGEAVAWGMVAAARIAELVGTCDTETAQRICEAVQASGKLPAVQSKPASIVRLLQSDKKTRDGVVHFVLPREIGKVEIVNDVPGSTVVEAVRWVAKSKIPPPRTLRSTKV
jgi:3-dehydroquinate synthase